MEEERKSKVHYEGEEVTEEKENSIEEIKVQKVKYNLDSQPAAPDNVSVHMDFFIQKIEEFLDGLTEKQILEEYDEICVQNRRYELENDIYEEFLEANDPALLQGLPAYLELHSRNPYIQLSSCSSAISLSNATANENMSSVTLSGRSGRGPRINISLRTDILLRSVEDMHISLEKFITKSHDTKNLLKAEQEETSINQGEVNEAVELFKNDVVIAGTDPITGRIPAEKYIRYMNDWMKSAQFTVDKMRLRLTTSKAKFQRLCTILEMKKEQSEGVHVVDFEKLTIENQRCVKKIEQKNNHLIELKRMTGQANFVVADHKNFLQQQLVELGNLNAKIKKIMKRTEALDKEYDKSMAQMEHEQVHLSRLKRMISNYQVPSVLSYANLKAEMGNLEKQVKVWKRKLAFQKVALQTQRYKLSKHIGTKYSKELYHMIKRQGNSSLINEWLFNLPSEGLKKSKSPSIDSLSEASIHSGGSSEEEANKSQQIKS